MIAARLDPLIGGDLNSILPAGRRKGTRRRWVLEKVAHKQDPDTICKTCKRLVEKAQSEAGR